MKSLQLLIAASLVACSINGGEHDGSGVVGSALDAHVGAGNYDGYRVIRPCPTRVTAGAPLALKGVGPTKLTTIDEVQAWSSRRLSPLLSEGTSVNGVGGVSLGCEDGIGAWVVLSDWREVDALVARIGAFIREDGVDAQVSIEVQGPMVATR